MNEETPEPRAGAGADDPSSAAAQTNASPAEPAKGKKRSILKIVGVIAACGALSIVVLFVVITQTSKARAKATYPTASNPIAVPTDAAAIEEGERLSRARGCSDCHGENLAGRAPIDDGALGRFVAPNITGGEGSTIVGWTDDEIAHVVRAGVRADGSPALFMPSHEYYRMPDSEIGAIIAYLRSVDPVDNDPGTSKIGPIGRVLHVTGGMAVYPAELIDHEAPRPPDVDRSDPIAFGGYLADGCIGCHGDGLSGGKIPGTPPDIPIPSNITQHETGLAAWSQDDFARAMREGVRPDGSELDPFMPSVNYAAMTDAEIGALWAYLGTVEPQEFGER